MRQLSKWIDTYKKSILFVCILLTVTAIPRLFFLEYSDSHTAFFDTDDPGFQEYSRIEEQYGADNTLLIALTPKEGDIFTPRSFSLFASLHDSLCQLKGFISAQSPYTTYDVRASFGRISFTPRFDTASPTQADLDSLRPYFLSDPLLQNRLISETGTYGGIFARFALEETKGAAALSRDIDLLLENLSRDYPDHTLMATGGVLIDNAFFTASFSDARIRIPLLYGTVFCILLWFTTSVKAAVAILSILLFPSALALCIAQGRGILLTAPSAMAPIIILTAGLADTIHMYVRYSHHLRKKHPPVQALQEAFQDTLIPITVTTLTTVAGFLLLLFSAVPPFRDLGLITAVGIFFAYLFSLFFFPALILTFFPCNQARQTKKHDIFGASLGRIVAHNRGKCIFIPLSIVLLSIPGLFRIEFNDRFYAFFDESYPFRRDTEEVMHHLTGLDYLTLSLGITPDSLTEKDLHALDSLERSWRNMAEVRHISGPATLLRRGMNEISGTDSLPGPAMARRMLSTYKREQKERSVPPFISAGGTHLRTEIFLDTLSSQEIRLLEENIRRDVEQVFPETEYLLHSPSLLFAHLSRDNLSSMLRITAASLGIISLVLLFLSGSLHMGLLSIIPNILPPLAAFGIWGIVYGQAGLGVSLGVALAIGIIVDDTVHILFAHMRSRKKGLSKNDATEHTLRHVSDAVILTSGILVVGFLFLATSGFEPTAHMGKMTVLIMFCALGIDLFLYTALLSGTQK